MKFLPIINFSFTKFSIYSPVNTNQIATESNATALFHFRCSIVPARFGLRWRHKTSFPGTISFAYRPSSFVSFFRVSGIQNIKNNSPIGYSERPVLIKVPFDCIEIQSQTILVAMEAEEGALCRHAEGWMEKECVQWTNTSRLA